jgi:8-amino-7-oxononanoate synthase
MCAVLDFTSALYLGLRHPSRSLRPWPALTSGSPAALMQPPGSADVAAGLAALQGCERATLAASTLHLFWDLFGILARERVRIFMDCGCYAIARWGVERAAALGTPIQTFPHHDATSLRELIAKERGDKRRPVIVCDGFCPACGQFAPIADYLRCTDVERGRLVIDDTQALGVFGADPSIGAPYGRYGGGSLRYFAPGVTRTVVISSLAKAFGAPLAALSGDERFVRRFEQLSETAAYCSPPSVAAINAAQRALKINCAQGDEWRTYLYGLVRRFCTRLAQIGLDVMGGVFPLLTLKPSADVDARALHERIRRRGVNAVLTRGCGAAGVCVSFLLTTLHNLSDIDCAVEIVGRALAPPEATPFEMGRAL